MRNSLTKLFDWMRIITLTIRQKMGSRTKASLSSKVNNICKASKKWIFILLVLT